MAVCSADLIARRFDAKVILMVREPTEVMASIRRYGWSLNSSSFIDQPSIAKFKTPDEHEQLQRLAEKSPDEAFATMAGLIWRIVHRLLEQTLADTPDVMIVNHRDLIADPNTVLNDVLEFLKLPKTKMHERFLEEHCLKTMAADSTKIPSPTDIRRPLNDATDHNRGVLTVKDLDEIRSITGSCSERVMALRKATSAGSS